MTSHRAPRRPPGPGASGRTGRRGCHDRRRERSRPSRSGRWSTRWPGCRAREARALRSDFSCRRSRRTSRSAASTRPARWNWANERESRRRYRFGRVPGDEVRRHVVGGAKGGTERNLRLAASSATSSNRRYGDHSTMASPTGSRPRRPARPVSWVYSPGVSSSWPSPGEPCEVLDHDAPGRHVGPEGQRLGREDHRHQARRSTPPRPPSTPGPFRRGVRRRPPAPTRSHRPSTAQVAVVEAGHAGSTTSRIAARLPGS